LIALRPSSPNVSTNTSTRVRIAPPEVSFGWVSIPAGLDTTAKCSSCHSVLTSESSDESPSPALTSPPLPFFFLARFGFLALDRLSAPAARRAAKMRSSASLPAWKQAAIASE